MADSSNVLHQTSDQRLLLRIDKAIYRFARHWLFAFNVIAFLLATLPFIIPFLASQGMTGLANWLYTTFGLMCHQMPERSFTLFGEQMALCHRMTAIYGASFLGGLGFAAVRYRMPSLGFRGLIWLSVPMALDGFTQLFGLRESTWELRLLTGSLFAFGVLWFALPRLEDGFREIRQVIESRARKMKSRSSRQRSSESND